MLLRAKEQDKQLLSHEYHAAAVVMIAFASTPAYEVRACQQWVTTTTPAAGLTNSPHTCIRRQPIS
jgi:hypothetical protein